MPLLHFAKPFIAGGQAASQERKTVPSLSLLFKALAERNFGKGELIARPNLLNIEQQNIDSQNMRDFHSYIAGQNDAVEYVFSNFS